MSYGIIECQRGSMMSKGSLEVVWKVSVTCLEGNGRCLQDVCKVSGRCLGGVCKVCRSCLEVVLKVPGGCLGGVCKVCGSCLGCVWKLF